MIVAQVMRKVQFMEKVNTTERNVTWLPKPLFITYVSFFISQYSRDY